MGQRNHVVYMHVAPNGKKYIGITCQRPEARWGSSGRQYRECPKMYNAIKKYGWDNFQHFVLYKGLNCKEAGALEQILIAWYQTTDNDKGYNICMGGEVGALGVKRSEETKKKMSAAAKGHTRLRGYKHSEQTKANMRAAQHWNMGGLGLKRSAETRELMSINNGKSRPVNQYSIDGEFIKTHASISSAGRSVSRSVGTIRGCCVGSQTTSAGFVWRYAENEQR